MNMFRRDFFFLPISSLFLNVNANKEEVIYNGKTKYFHINSQIVRIETGDGITTYYKNGELHREDGPAFVKENDTGWEYKFYIEGKLHRLDGPAHLKSDGWQSWHIDGMFHRENGPAIIYGASQSWYYMNKLHRLGGPAVINSDWLEWWENGEQIDVKANQVFTEKIV